MGEGQGRMGYAPSYGLGLGCSPCRYPRVDINKYLECLALLGIFNRITWITIRTYATKPRASNLSAIGRVF